VWQLTDKGAQSGGIEKECGGVWKKLLKLIPLNCVEIDAGQDGAGQQKERRYYSTSFPPTSIRIIDGACLPATLIGRWSNVSAMSSLSSDHPAKLESSPLSVHMAARIEVYPGHLRHQSPAYMKISQPWLRASARLNAAS